MTLLDSAMEAHRSGAYDQARGIYEQVLREDPENPDALALMGVLLDAVGQHQDGMDYIERAIRLDPKAALFYYYLGNACRGADCWDKARAAYEKAVELQPAFAPAHFFLGLSLSRCERHEEALPAYRRAFELDSQAFEALDNCALTHQVLGEQEKARAVFQELLVQSKQDVDDKTLMDGPEDSLGLWHYHLSLLELRLGDYRRGFARYRSRFATRKRPNYSAPLWRGEDLRSKTLLVYTEQGYGDALMLSRYLPLVKAKGARVIFQCAEPLVSLFKGWQGIDDVLAPQDPLPAFDFYASLFDLPHVMATTIETVPHDTSYLPLPSSKPLPVLQEYSLPKVGVVWAGNPDNGTDALRSLPLSIFAQIFDVKEATFFNLTYRCPVEDTTLLVQQGVVDFSRDIQNFSDAAHMVAQMDLIICCDTAIAHLAGGLGKKVWTLLPYDPDWRWGLTQEVSLWYPSMRLFRQPVRGDWESVIKRVKRELAQALPHSV